MSPLDSTDGARSRVASNHRRPPFSHRRYMTFLRREWWIPLLSTLVSAGLAAAYVSRWPASYSCTAQIWAAGRMGLQLREGTTYAEDNVNFAGTQIELLQSGLILDRAFHRVRNSLHLVFSTNSSGKPELPTLKVLQLPRSAVLRLRAKGSDGALVMAFLNAAMDEFLAYKKEVRTAASGDTYASVSERTVRQEGELKAEQDKLTTYMRDNNVAVLEEQAKAASIYLTQLLAELSELKLQHQLLQGDSPDQPWAWSASTNTPAGAPDPRKPGGFALPSPTPPPEFISAQQELEKIRILRLRLSRHLRPAHPKIIKLDEQIAQGEELVELLQP